MISHLSGTSLTTQPGLPLLAWGMRGAGSRGKAPQSPPTHVIPRGCASGYMFVRENKEEGGRRAYVTHTHTHAQMAGGGPPAGPCARPRDAALAQPPAHSVFGSLLSLDHHTFSWTLKRTQEVLRHGAVFVPGKGAQRNRGEDLPASPNGACDCSPTSSPPHRRLKAPVGEFPGSPGPGHLGGTEQLPQAQWLCRRRMPACDFAVTHLGRGTGLCL